MTVGLSLTLSPSLDQHTGTRTRVPYRPGLSGDWHVEGRFTHQRNYPVERAGCATGLPHQSVAHEPEVRSDAI